RTLLNLQHVETGFNTRNLLLFSVDPTLIGYKDERLKNLYQQMSERIEAMPGVSSVTFSHLPLLSEASMTKSFYLPGAKAAADGRVTASSSVFVNHVRENFLESMGIPLLTGRGLTSHDDARAPRVAVVNQTFAKRWFPNENPVGKRFGFDSEKTSEIEIVGLVRDAKYTSRRDEVPPTVYLSWL